MFITNMFLYIKDSNNGCPNNGFIGQKNNNYVFVLISKRRGHRGLVGLFVNNKFILCQGSADRIPVSLFLLFINVPAANCSEEMRVKKSGTGGPSREKKGGSGESKKKDRQAFQEWIREVVRFVSKDD